MLCASKGGPLGGKVNDCVQKVLWVFPCASYHAGTKSYVLSGDVMCENVYVALANYSRVCMYMHVSGEEGVRVAWRV